MQPCPTDQIINRVIAHWTVTSFYCIQHGLLPIGFAAQIVDRCRGVKRPRHRIEPAGLVRVEVVPIHIIAPPFQVPCPQPHNESVSSSDSLARQHPLLAALGPGFMEWIQQCVTSFETPCVLLGATKNAFARRCECCVCRYGRAPSCREQHTHTHTHTHTREEERGVFGYY